MSTVEPSPIFFEPFIAACVESMHVPAFWHGLDLHSFTSVAQFAPENPLGHLQEYLFGPSTHVAPFLHGYDAHSSRSSWHVVPAKPFGHLHEYCVSQAAAEHLPSTHVPPFRHGDDAHSTMFWHTWPAFVEA